jgi:hypothetical protein
MKLIDKKNNEKNYLAFNELLGNVPFICDAAEYRARGLSGSWLPQSDAKKCLYSRDDRGLVCLDGTTMQVEAADYDLRFLNVYYVEVLEVIYVGVDG